MTGKTAFKVLKVAVTIVGAACTIVQGVIESKELDEKIGKVVSEKLANKS